MRKFISYGIFYRILTGNLPSPLIHEDRDRHCPVNLGKEPDSFRNFAVTVVTGHRYSEITGTSGVTVTAKFTGNFRPINPW